jgi:HEAT repeat protein
MKRLFALLLLVAAASACIADETAEIYQTLYKQANGLPQKYAAVLNIVALNDKTTAPILASALDELLLTQKSYSSRTDADLYGQTVQVLARALGDYKYAVAAPSLWDVVQQVPDPLARAEALISIGKLRDLDYVERIALKLRDLNLQPATDADADEKIAYGAIVALDRLKDPRGFASVFFAADSWYSSRTRQQAAQSLADISDDPTAPIKEILGTEDSPARRLRALQAEAASKASDGRKIEVAVLVLNLGHLKGARDKAEAKALSDQRKLALRCLIAYKASGLDPVDGCGSSYAKGYDDEERLLALSALGVNGSDQSATLLRDIILQLDAEQQAGIADETRNRMAKAAIENTSLAKNKIVRPALLAVSMDDKWSGGIILAAKSALKDMP